MKITSALPLWTIATLIVAWLLLAGTQFGLGGAFLVLVAAGLIGCVLAAVHHAEVVAHRVGEPLGTLVLAVAVTVIEVALIVSLMLAGGAAATALARDTGFAAVMIILNGIVGGCLLLGGARHHEQSFGLYGVSASFATLAAIVVLTLILPSYTVSNPGPFFTASQLAFIAVVSLILYGTFVFAQIVRHRDYFLPATTSGDEATHAAAPTRGVASVSAVLLVASLGVVVLLSLFVTSISLGTGRTTVLQGTVLLVIFATYLFTTIVP